MVLRFKCHCIACLKKAVKMLLEIQKWGLSYYQLQKQCYIKKGKSKEQINIHCWPDLFVCMFFLSLCVKWTCSGKIRKLMHQFFKWPLFICRGDLCIKFKHFTTNGCAIGCHFDICVYGWLAARTKGCYLSGCSWEKMPYQTCNYIPQTFLKTGLYLSITYLSATPAV